METVWVGSRPRLHAPVATAPLQSLGGPGGLPGAQGLRRGFALRLCRSSWEISKGLWATGPGAEAAQHTSREFLLHLEGCQVPGEQPHSEGP